MKIDLITRKDYRVNDYVSVHIPTLQEVFDFGSREYMGLVSTLVATPYESMVMLDDMGVDFTEVDEWFVFTVMFLYYAKKYRKIEIIFGDLDLSLFQKAVNKETGEDILYDFEHGYIIDRLAQEQISKVLRESLQFEKHDKIPGNATTKRYLIERERRKLRRAAEKGGEQLEDIILALVNTPEFKYNFEQSMDLTLYQFNSCVKQIQKKISFDHRMNGIYAGTVDATKLDKDDLTWI